MCITIDVDMGDQERWCHSNYHNETVYICSSCSWICRNNWSYELHLTFLHFLGQAHFNVWVRYLYRLYWSSSSTPRRVLGCCSKAGSVGGSQLLQYKPVGWVQLQWRHARTLHLTFRHTILSSLAMRPSSDQILADAESLLLNSFKSNEPFLLFLFILKIFLSVFCYFYIFLSGMMLANAVRVSFTIKRGNNSCLIL